MEPNTLDKLEKLFKLAKKMEGENKNMKCCGNCGVPDIDDLTCSHIFKRERYGYCDSWKSDGLKREDRYYGIE